MAQRRSAVLAPVGPHDEAGKLAAVASGLHCAYTRLSRRRTAEPLTNHSDTEDALQEAALRALVHCSTLRLDWGTLTPWLRTTTRHLEIDELRKARREEMVLCRDVEQLQAIASPKQQAESRLILSEEQQRTLDAANALAPSFREVFFMFHRDELSHSEIGKKLGISEDASKMRLYRAHEILRKQLGPETGEILNSLRCRLPPLFFFDVYTAHRDREKNRIRYDRVQRSANVCAALVAASLAFFYVDIPCAKTGHDTTPMTIAFANGAQPKEDLPEQTAIPAPQTSTAQTRGSAARTPETINAKPKRSREIDIDLSRVFQHGSDE